MGLTEVGVEQIERAWRVVSVAAVQTHCNRDERRTRRSSTTVPRRGSSSSPTSGCARRALRRWRRSPRATARNTTQIALAWLLRRSPTVLPIPSTLSLAHVKENLAALEVESSDKEFEALR